MGFALSLFYAEILCGIGIRNIPHGIRQKIYIAGVFPFLYQIADQLAQNTAEILMARIGKKASGIRDHTDKLAKHAEVGKRFHLFTHTVVIVVKPPRRAELDFGRHFGTLEIAEHGAEYIIILRVERKQNGTG